MNEENEGRNCPCCLGDGKGPYGVNLAPVPCESCEGTGKVYTSRPRYGTDEDHTERVQRYICISKRHARYYREMLGTLTVVGKLDRSVNWANFYSGGAEVDYELICGKEVPVFEAVLELNGYSRGRSAANFHFTVAGNEEVALEMGMSTTLDLFRYMLKNPEMIQDGGIKGLWTFAKQGKSLHVLPVSEAGDWVEVDDWSLPTIEPVEEQP